jgi:hypothetical protein
VTRDTCMPAMLTPASPRCRRRCRPRPAGPRT